MEKGKLQKAEAIFRRVLKEIKPSEVEIRENTANVNAIMHKLGKIVGKDVELRVAGSIARGTNLKGIADIDIFMLFPKGTKKEFLVKQGIADAKKLCNTTHNKYEIKYAEHPYVRMFITEMGLKVDLVPALKIDSIEEMGTTVDRTPLHTEFIMAHLNSRQKDDVRLLKFLLKAHNIYGAEVKIGGFPGYLCELLIYQYGSLVNLLEAASKFRKPVILDPISRTSLIEDKLVKKFNSEFIVIDPVDRNRNVAAGASPETLGRFVLVARQFVQNPDISAFKGLAFSAPKTHKELQDFIKQTGLDFFLIAAKVPPKSEDIVWPQLRKVSELASEHLSRSGFSTYAAIPWVDNDTGLILIIAPHYRLGSRLLKGPSAFIGDASTNFIKSHPSAFGVTMSGDNLYILERSGYPEIKDILEDMIKGRMPGKRKDVSLRSAKLWINDIPAKYSESAYFELKKKFSI